MVPIGLILHRHREFRQDINAIRDDIVTVKETVAEMRAHGENTKNGMDRLVTVLDRIEARMNQRRRGEEQSE